MGWFLVRSIRNLHHQRFHEARINHGQKLFIKGKNQSRRGAFWIWRTAIADQNVRPAIGGTRGDRPRAVPSGGPRASSFLASNDAVAPGSGSPVPTFEPGLFL